MSEPGSREGGRPQLQGGPRPHRLAGVTEPGTRRRRGRAGPRRAFSSRNPFREAQGRRAQGPGEGGVSAGTEKGTGSCRMRRGSAARRRGVRRETKAGCGRRGPAPARRGRRADQPFSPSRGPTGDAEPCDQPAAPQTNSPLRPTALPNAPMKNGKGKRRSGLPALGNRPLSEHT